MNSLKNSGTEKNEFNNIFYNLLTKFSRILILIALMVILTILSPSFASVTNLLNVFRQSVPQIIIALGITVVLIAGGIDLSVGSTATLASIVAAYAMKNAGLSWVPGVALGLLVGVAVGFVNGFLITKTKLPAAIGTYGMLWVGSGLSFSIMGAFPIFGFSDRFRFIGIGYFFGLPVQVVLTLFLIFLFGFILKYTVFGRNIYAVGSNYTAAIASGIRSDRVLIKAYVICGAMSAVGGIVLLARLNAADQNAGASLLLPAIAGPVMGGTSMSGGEGGVWGALVGSLIIVIITNGMNLLKVSSLWQQLIIGLTVILSVWLDYLLKKNIDKN